jgi:hypothetical protein
VLLHGQQAAATGVEERRPHIGPPSQNLQRSNFMGRNTLMACLLLGGTAAAFAQGTANTVQRDINQQTRIERGLQSGALNTKEAAALEREESHVDQMQTKALKDGKLTPAEQAKLNQAQNKVSTDIYAAKYNNVTGSPQSASSQRMQADVQRSVNQQQRVENGVQNGSLTNREVAKLERGQSKVAKAEARAGSDGHVTANRQQRVQHAENHQSKHVNRQKHDAQQKN